MYCLTVFVAYWNGLGFHRLTPWYGRINQMISRMKESGLITFWKMRFAHINLSIHIESLMLSSRTWREMRTDFQLKGGEQVGVSDDTRNNPLSMEDCMGVFFLWLLILITGLVG